MLIPTPGADPKLLAILDDNMEIIEVDSLILVSYPSKPSMIVAQKLSLTRELALVLDLARAAGQ